MKLLYVGFSSGLEYLLLVCFITTAITSNGIRDEKKSGNLQANDKLDRSSNTPLSAIFIKPDEQQCRKNDHNACKIQLPNTMMDEYVPPPLPKGFVGPKFQRVHLALPRREIKEVGSVEEIVVNGRNMTLKLLSLKPPVFEISNFLSDNETELIIEEAEDKGMKDLKISAATVNLQTELNELIFDDWDVNFDGKISVKEFHELKELDNLMLSQEDIKIMLNKTEIDKDMSEYLTYSELKGGGLVTIKDYLTERETNKSLFKTKGVKETWLWHDEDELLSYENLLEDYHDRISEITGIPRVLIEQTEPLQVQKKEKYSFTPCQYDSNIIRHGTKCCVYGGTDCQICRYASIHIFLNDIEGGAVVFPLSDEKEVSTKRLMKDKLIQKCEEVPHKNLSNLIIPAKRGNAILWYNHEVSVDTGWLGQLEHLSMSGMTRVESDIPQWTARMWIDIVGNGVRELRPWRLGTNWLSQNNRNSKVIEELRNDYFYEGEEYKHEYRKIYRRSLDDTLTEKDEKEGEEKLDIKRTEHVPKEQTVSTTSIQHTKESNDKQTNILENDNSIELPVGPLPPAHPKGMGLLNMPDKHKELRDTLSKVITPTLSDKIDHGTIDSRYVQAALLLLQELDRDELETVARTLYEKLQVNCIPMIINPLG